jgi:hypothetical protein
MHTKNTAVFEHSNPLATASLEAPNSNIAFSPGTSFTGAKERIV